MRFRKQNGSPDVWFFGDSRVRNVFAQFTSYISEFLPGPQRAMKDNILFNSTSGINLVRGTNLLQAWESLIRTMMTSSNENIIRVTGHLCGEFIGRRWSPCTKASDAELWCSLWFASDLRRYRAHCDVTAMPHDMHPAISFLDLGQHLTR